MKSNVLEPGRPRVVIIGGGFGGLAAANRLAGQNVQVTLLDRTNHHLFQPLLYQVATGGLSPSHIAQPIRAILREAKNVTVILGDAQRIDVAARQVITEDATLSYDYLIVAAGARHSYFGHDEWEKFAPGLKNIEDALELRRRILMAFELAEKATDPAQKKAALTFVVIGAGPTGVEMAGSIAEMARFSLRKDFRHIDSSEAHVLLLDAAPRVLPMFAEDLSAKARNALEKMHIEVRTGVTVKNITADTVQAGEDLIRTRTIIWAAGNAAAPLGKTLGVELDRAGRVIVQPDLSVAGHPEIFVVGDQAHFAHTTGGKPLPGVSPVAMQQGRHAAENVLALLEARQTKPFSYLDKGSMATIGRHAAVADLHFWRFDGYLAWLAWLFVHLIFLVGLRNRIAVIFQWFWAYITFSRGARLITSPRSRD